MSEQSSPPVPVARPLIGTSWKMNFTRPEAREYLSTLRQLLPAQPGLVFVLPPFTNLAVAEEALQGSQITYGAQDVHPDQSGAHTGDISAPMLAELGCRIVEIGHSERRRDHHESDDLIARKARTVLDHGMWPLLCVGESAEDRDAGREEPVVLRQLAAALGWMGPTLLARTIIAYEPWWAIGAGATVAPLGHVHRLHRLIDAWLSKTAGGTRRTPILYGGSVDLVNAEGLLRSPAVDGLFVGRAALDPFTFAAIVRLGMASAESAAHSFEPVGQA